ncbi:MAG: hypothetical protein ABIN61_04115 [candidate division WOR-3 bacterium]
MVDKIKKRGTVINSKRSKDKKQNMVSLEKVKIENSILLEESETPRRKWIQLIVLIFVSGIVISLGIYYRWDKLLIGIGVFLFGLVAQGWASLVSLLGGIPIIGNVIVKFLALPFLFLINAIGNFLSFLAIKMGYKREIMDAKLLAWVFAGGLLIGFIIGAIL